MLVCYVLVICMPLLCYILLYLVISCYITLHCFNFVCIAICLLLNLFTVLIVKGGQHWWVLAFSGACHCTSTNVFVLCYFTRQIKFLLLLLLLLLLHMGTSEWSECWNGMLAMHDVASQMKPVGDKTEVWRQY